MPFTPFHFGLGAALHSMSPKHVSFLAFCSANVLVDFEPAYYMLMQQDPLHRFFHTYAGISLVIAATTAVFLVACWLSARVPLPNLFGWHQLRLPGVLVGSALGGYSHIALDSVMHSDIRPFAPFTDANTLYLLVGIDGLHWWCVVAGIVGVVVLGIRRGASAP